jgi:cell wall-associated NlpC family hydrolase
MTEKQLIKKYLGKPFTDAFNCWTLVKEVYADRGYSFCSVDIDTMNHIECRKLIDTYRKEWDEIESPQPFDLVVFTNANDVPFHCGIMLDDTRFIHCSRRAGVVVSRVYDKGYDKRLEGFYRLRG